MGFVSSQRASRDLKPLITTTPSKNMSLRQSLVSSLSLVAVFAAAAVASAEETLPTPRSIILAAGQEEAAKPVILAARRYAAFWNTGEARYAEAALARTFVDRTLPSGRPQGLSGVLEASKNFRAAIPDLKAEIEELLVVHDHAVVRYSFTGHFTGRFKDLKGDGREISFRAVDIYRVQNGQISDNWHLEDNLSLMQQLGVVKP
jgi:predicted ester cyclase